MPRPSIDNRTRLALAGIVVLGAALRLYGLDRQSLWNDELGVIQDVGLPSLRDVFMFGPEPSLVPGYWAFMYLWTHAVGTSEVAMRLPSALLGIATIPAMFALGRRWYGRCEGLIAAAITAVAWMPLYYSQEARPYAMLLLGAALSAAWLTDVVVPLRAGIAPGRGALIRYVGAAIVTAYSHYFGVAFIGLQAAAATLLLLRRPRGLARLAGVYGVVLAAFVPVLYRAWQIAPKGPNWLKRPQVDALWRLLAFFLDRSDAIVWLALAVCAAAVVRTVIRRAAVAPATLLLVAWLVVPVAVTYGYSQWVAPRFLDRALIFVAPPVYLLLARALMRLPLPQVSAPAVVVLFLVHVVGLQAYYTAPTKEQFREAAAYLVAHDEGTAEAALFACVWNIKLYNHYLERFGSARRVERTVHKAADAAIVLAAVAARHPADVWLLDGHRKCTPELLRTLHRRLVLVDEQHFIQANVWHYRLRDP